ncbi:hypothetical protein D6764_03340, partial [Candidatus Woesearchaeota archaeon]
MWLGAFLILSLFVRPVFDNSDTMYYLSLIEGKNLSENTPHWGYTLLGMIFTTLIPFNDILSLNIMSAFFASLAVYLTFLIFRTLKFSERVSLISTVITLFSYSFFTSGFLAEVYVVQSSLLLISLFLWLEDRVLLSSLSFLLALLVSPI